MIEEDVSSSLILAATNHPEILDHALFRRFDDVIEYDLPTVEQAMSILRARLGRFAPAQIDLRSLAESASGLSHADITRAAEEGVKNAVMQDTSLIDESELQKRLVNRPLTRKSLPG
jgi:AAA+ superfamily predicted ATPase